ncbi:MAG: DMT family transporter [Planctomycetota bacterium]
MPYILFVFVCLIWGTSFLLMRWASALFNAPAIGAGRMFGGMLALSVFWLLVRRFATSSRPWSLARKDIPALGFLVVVGFAVPWTLQPYLIGRFQQSGLFGMMVSLVPMLTVVVSLPMLGVRPTLRQCMGVLLGLGMIAILFADAVGAHGVPAWAMALAVAVPLCYAVSNTWVKLRFHDADSMLLSAVVMGAGLLFMLPVARVNDAASDVSIGKAVASVAILGIVGSGLAIWMFYKLIQLRGPLFAGMVTYVVPGIAVLLGWLIEDEVVTTWQLLALLGIVVSVALVQWPTTVRATTTEAAD